MLLTTTSAVKSMRPEQPNAIFEDTKKAVIYQNNKPAFTADLTNPQELADLRLAGRAFRG